MGDEVVSPSLVVRRNPDPELPGTVEVLTTKHGCKVYLVGTAHFSESSQEDVAKVGDVHNNRENSTVTYTPCCTHLCCWRMKLCRYAFCII